MQCYGPVSGEALVRLFACKQFTTQVLPASVAIHGPQEAHYRIANAYGLPRYFMPSQLAIFQAVSRRVKRYNANLVVQAPHSHWVVGRPIIYSFESSADRYRVGLHEVRKEWEYYPVSFVRYSGSVYPYEWTDPSVRFERQFWDEHYAAIEDVMINIVTDNDPIGIGIDFRFRHGAIEFQPLIEGLGSVEFPIGTPGSYDSDFSQIIRDDVFEQLVIEHRDTVNVGWPCHCDEDLNLSMQGLDSLNTLRGVLASMETPEQRTNYLIELEQQLELR